MHDAGWRKTVQLWELTTALGLDMSVYGQYKLENATLFQISYYLFTPWGVEARDPIQAHVRIYRVVQKNATTFNKS